MRQKAYYTKNEIETNLYTTGKQFMLTDRTEYIGLYHRYIVTHLYIPNLANLLLPLCPCLGSRFRYFRQYVR